MTKKSNIRVITASDDIANAIDIGADVDADLKDLTKEDKVIKAKIVEASKKVFEDNEISVRMKGGESAALITAVETYILNTNSPLMKDITTFIEEGILTGVIDKKQQLVVPPHLVEKALGILKNAGLTEATVTETFPINADGLRKFKSEFADKEFLKKLENDVAVDVTFRVKYERHLNENPVDENGNLLDKDVDDVAAKINTRIAAIKANSIV
jgi:hypothetical protein